MSLHNIIFRLSFIMLLISVSSLFVTVYALAPNNVAEASISSKLGVSTLVDKETGQVYWHSGSRAALPYVEFKHFKATILTVLLLVSVLSMITGKLMKLILNDASSSAGKKHTVVGVLVVVSSVINKILPHFSNEFILLVGILYLLEAFTCSTRRYLSNIMSPNEIEELIEKLRESPPSVTWTVRCYHYENRLLGSSRDRPVDHSASSKKIITHTAKKEYQFGSWRDNTVVSIWERAKPLKSSTAPFTKISLSKMLVLSDIKTRQDYFSQQASFIAMEGRRDDHAEFSTAINVEGFKQKLLAIRTVIGAPKTGIVRPYMFWIFTLLGLTVPYRSWFSSHCDDLCVTIVKETTASGVYPRKPLLPKLWSSKISEMEPEDAFVRNMKEYLLYSNDNKSKQPLSKSIAYQTERELSSETSLTDVLAEDDNALNESNPSMDDEVNTLNEQDDNQQ